MCAFVLMTMLTMLLYDGFKQEYWNGLKEKEN